jgi:hypothetical protein
MAQTPRTNAQDQRRSNLRNALRLLKNATRLLDAAVKADDSSMNWGHTGDAGYVLGRAQDLAEAVAHVYGKA